MVISLNDSYSEQSFILSSFIFIPEVNFSDIQVRKQEISEKYDHSKKKLSDRRLDLPTSIDLRVGEMTL